MKRCAELISANGPVGARAKVVKAVLTLTEGPELTIAPTSAPPGFPEGNFFAAEVPPNSQVLDVKSYDAHGATVQ